MDNEQLDAAIAARPHEKVTKEQMEARIVSTDYFVLPGTTVTICSLTLDNGYSVRGESACVDARNFDEAIGRALARREAFERLWPLFGFLLAERRHYVRTVPASSSPEEAIARVAHEINRAYCQALGDDSQPAWEAAPDWQRSSAITGVRFHLANPDAGPSHSHECWLAEKAAAGWRYGETKDPEAKMHPCFVPYDQLPVEQRAKDYLFRAVVHAMTRLVAAVAA